MAGLILPSRLNQQPQQASPLNPNYFGTAAVNVSHPAWPLGVGVFSGVACDVRASRAGMAWSGNGSTAQRVTSSVSGYPLTVIGSVVARDVTTNRVFTTVGAVAGGSSRIQIDVNAGTLRAIAVGSTTPSQTVAVAVNQVLNFVFVCDNATSRRLYLNGRLVSTDTTSCTFSDTFTTIAINCGANATFANGSQFIDGDTALNVVAQVALSDAKARELSANPWAMFQAPQRRLWGAAGGGPQSLTVTPTGGLVFSGAANVIRSAGKQASGGLTFAGAATVRRGVLRAVSGGITLSGTAAQRRGAVRAPAGGVVFAGTAPYVPTTSSQSRVVTPTGGIVFAGTAPTVRKMRYTPVGGITFGGAAGYTNSGVVAALYAITRRRARPRVFPTQ